MADMYMNCYTNIITHTVMMNDSLKTGTKISNSRSTTSTSHFDDISMKAVTDV